MKVQEEFGYATRFIRKIAARMVGQTGLLEADIPDLEQGLWLELLSRIPRYNPDRGGPRAFITLVVRNKRASILKARLAAKRGGGCPCLSLNKEIEGDDGETAEMQEGISEDDYLRRTRGAVRSAEDRRDLALDLRRLIESLQPRDRVVCLLLIDRDVRNVARVVGMPRSTLRDLVKRLQRTAEEWGLQEYFGLSRHFGDGIGK